ncbi:hypothetical protein [Persephonella sp.]
MKRLLGLILMFFGVSYGDTLILTDGKYQTYIQQEEFMVAEGENIIGPISLLPIAVVDAVDVSADNLSIKRLIIEKTSQDWKKNLLGKFVTVEGEGRVIRGTVISIDDRYITISGKKGFIVTTIPEFSSRISSHLRWEELFSPQLTLKVNSQEAKTQIFKVSYPIKGIKWKISYVLKIRNGLRMLKGYILIDNNTPVDFKRINLVINGRIKKSFKDMAVPPFTQKRIEFIKKQIQSADDLKNLPAGSVHIYKNGVYKSSKRLNDVFR